MITIIDAITRNIAVTISFVKCPILRLSGTASSMKWKRIAVVPQNFIRAHGNA